MKFSICFFFLITIFALPRLSHSQWQQTSGPYGVDVHALAQSGDTLYAATGGGMFRKLPGQIFKLQNLAGQSLNDVWTTPSAYFTTFVDTVPNQPSGAHLLVSTDLGDSWNSAGTPFSHAVVKFWALASVRDSGKDRIYVSASFVTIGGFNFFSSTDHGLSWMPVTSAMGIPSVWVHTLTTIGDTLYAATSTGLFVKIPGVPKWSRVQGLPGNVNATSGHFDGATFYLATTDGIYYSNDRIKWIQNSSLVGIKSFATFNGVTVADDSLEYYYTADHGTRWSLVPSISSLQGHIGILARPADLVVTTTNAIYSLSSPTIAPVRIDSGIINNDVYALYSFGDRLYARTKTGFASTSDAGDTWSTISSPSHPGVTSQLAAAAGYLFAGGIGLYRTLEQGRTWDTLKGGLANFATVNAIAASDSTVYAASSTAGQSRLFISKDLGQTWRSADTDVPGLVYAIHANGARVIVFADDGLYNSANHGTTWKKQTPPTYAGTLGVSIVATGKTIIANAQNIFRSVNDGVDWNLVTDNLPDGIDRLAMIGKDAAVGTVKGVYVSSDTGATWHASNSGLVIETPSVALDSKYIYAGTYGSSMWRLLRTQSRVLSTVDNQSFSLYPNPAHSEIRLNISAAITTDSRALLFDALGRMVRSFVPGSLNLSLEGLSTGIYQLELRNTKTGATFGRQKLAIVR
jgi:photosystem II stability/assembly factor-like uncharacterized protein